MTHSIYNSLLGAAVLLASSVVTQATHAQSSWNHGFGARNYGYAGDAYSNPNFGNSSGFGNSTGFGYSNNYVTGYSPYYGVNPYYGVYPYYAYSGVGLGIYPYGYNNYAVGPGYYGAYYPQFNNQLNNQFNNFNVVPNGNMRLNGNVRAAPAKKPKKQPQGAKKDGAKKPEPGAARAF